MSQAEPSPTATVLLLLGRGTDRDAEHGVECPGQLPVPSDPSLLERAARAKAALGDRLLILGHHYQRDEVIRFADVTGDSFKLSREAAARPRAEYVVFCGVHFMAESADILTRDHQRVVLPDLAAGCSMADMATLNQVERCWELLGDLGIAEETVPVTYINSSADIKGFVGRRGGVVCTSSNAERALRWAFGDEGDERDQPPERLARARDEPDTVPNAEPNAEPNGRHRRVLFLPDQHLGRNTAVFQLGLSLDDCVVYDPRQPGGGVPPERLRAARMILWRGHCSVHGRFTVSCVEEVRQRVPDVTVLVHPECRHEVVAAADLVGSTEYIIKTIDAAPPGSAWAIGTELNLVRRLANANPDKRIVFLDRSVCYCSTMNRIDLPHLVWTLEELLAGRVVNQVTVEPTTAQHARIALDRMLRLP